MRTETVRSMHGVEKRQKKEKQNIMNDIQIVMIENPLNDDPG